MNVLESIQTVTSKSFSWFWALFFWRVYTVISAAIHPQLRSISEFGSRKLDHLALHNIQEHFFLACYCWSEITLVCQLFFASFFIKPFNDNLPWFYLVRWTCLLWLRSSVIQYRNGFFKHCGLYFNYQYSRGASLSAAVFGFLPQCGCFPAPWQAIALPAAINWFCNMLFRSVIWTRKAWQTWITISSISAFISSPFPFPDFTLSLFLLHSDQPAIHTV